MTQINEASVGGSRLQSARDYEERFSGNIEEHDRPAFHLPARIGWMNDPNGFSFYNGRYHLFYQYYPYHAQWGKMHWGHAATDDLLHWDFLPCALAPSEKYDDGMGCFSGSAVSLPDGRHMLMYTGVCDAGRNPDGTHAFKQVQCLAFGDGVDYVKYRGNPVIDEKLLPEGASTEHFRDPKMWIEEDGTFRCVAGSLDENKLGQILRFASDDGLVWRYDGVLARNDGSTGVMWECPDTFELDGYQVLLTSPQDMLAEGNEFMSGNGTVCLVGHLDPTTGELVAETRRSIDYGIDFYAPQTVLAPDGRRIMVAWMQNWDSVMMGDHRPWFGQMTLPRELSVRDGRLCQRPVRELDEARCNAVAYHDVPFEGELSLPGVEGRVVDLEVSVRPANGRDVYQEFAIWFAQNDRFHSSIRYRPQEGILKINRKHSGLRRAVVYTRKCEVPSPDGTLKLRIVLDRMSVEVFVGNGEQTLTMAIPTDLSADRITFFADGCAVIDVEKYDIEQNPAPARRA